MRRYRYISRDLLTPAKKDVLTTLQRFIVHLKAENLDIIVLPSTVSCAIKSVIRNLFNVGGPKLLKIFLRKICVSHDVTLHLYGPATTKTGFQETP